MSDESPYNPLDKLHLGESVANAILDRPVTSLPPAVFSGAGVYAIYYTGDFPPYHEIARRNRNGKYELPIYVGKAIPKGARRVKLDLNISPGRYLHSRLREHAQSIHDATNLELADFQCRYLVVDHIWIPLGEALLIQKFAPLWNTTIDGFGNHDPGSGRHGQKRSPWDVLHPGRNWAEKCKESPHTEEDLLKAVHAWKPTLPR